MASLLLVAVGLQQISERLRQSRGLVHQARGLGDRGGHGTDPECADLAFVDRELAAALPDERVDATPVLEHGSKMVDAVEAGGLRQLWAQVAHLHDRTGCRCDRAT